VRIILALVSERKVRQRPLHFGGAQTSLLALPGQGSLSITNLPLQELSLLVFEVGVGRDVKDLKAYDKDESLVSRNADTEKLRDSSCHPASCRGQAIESEFVIWPSRR
jgi:hypothetical protein